MLVCLCVCVRALYVDGWCTGLEGKRSRLLSLRTCQSSAERNQKESKSQHWARVYVCVHVFVCVWNAFSHLAIPKNKWGGKRVRMGDGCGAAWRHTALQWFSAASPLQTTQTCGVNVWRWRLTWTQQEAFLVHCEGSRMERYAKCVS